MVRCNGSDCVNQQACRDGFVSRALALLALLLVPACSARRLESHGINLVIGDAALVAFFAGSPPIALGAKERTRIHLEYVRRMLAAIPDAGLSATLRQARRTNLARLAPYIARGEFPRNEHHPDPFRPVFMDDGDRICAVGYLFAADRGLSEARRVASRYRHAFIAEIRDPELLAWARGSGLTLDELAMIQPSYPSVVSRRHPPPPITLDQQSGESHAGVQSGVEIGGPAGGVVGTSFDAEWLAIVRRGSKEGTGFGLGPYLGLGASLPTRPSAALTNTDVGAVFVNEHPSWGRLVLHAGALLPTAPRAASPSAANARTVPMRLSDAVLHLPHAKGARLGISPIMILDWLPYDTLGAPNDIVIRLDGGVDLYSSDGASLRAAPRLNAAVGAMYPGGAFYLESVSTWLELPGEEPRLLSTLAGSFRLRWTRGRWYSPLEAGLGALVPLTRQLPGWSLLFDLRMTLGPATRFECC